MKNWFQDKILNMAIFSEYWQTLGLGLIVLVTIYDILRLGMLGFRDYAIGYKGIVLIWVGVGLIVASKRANRYVNGEEL